MTLPRTWFALTLTVRLVEPLAGTVTLAGNEILASPAEVVPAPQMVPSAPAAGVNLRACRLNDAELALAFVSLRLTLVGVLIDPLTLPKLAATGAKATVATAELDRFSRPPPCWVGPTPSLPFDAFLMTRSAVLTRADFTRAGDQVGWRASSTAADPAMCGVAMDVPLKNAQASALHGLAEHGMELRTLTPTDVRSGLTARSTFVGPWLLKPARISAFGVMNSLKDASADAVVAPEARSAAPSTMPIMTAGRLSPPSPSLAMAVGSPATLFTTSTPTAPAAALRTFVLKVQTPRLMIASLPAAPAGTLVHPLEAVSNRL